MEILTLFGTVMDLNHWMVLAMFLTFVFTLFRGIPVAFALVSVGLIYSALGEAVPDPARSLINE